MTEKRYKSIGTNLECPNGMKYMLIKRNDGFNVCQVCSKHTAKEIVDELNSLAEENEQLKSTINTLTCDNTKMKKVLNTTKNENEHIKNTIQEAYNNERTKLGQSVLKQLLEAIQ